MQSFMFASTTLTLHDGQQYDNDKEEESDVEQHAEVLLIVPIWRLQFIT